MNLRKNVRSMPYLAFCVLTGMLVVACPETPEVQYTITFSTNGGTALASVTASCIEAFPVSAKTGNALAGWYSNSVLSPINRITFPYEPDSDTMLYAKWIPATEGLTYELTSISAIEGYGVFLGTATPDETVTIPEFWLGLPVVVIGKDAFRSCASFVEIAVPDGVISIGDGAFMECSGLASVTLPNSLVTIGQCAFWGCNNLKGLVLPESVTTIEYQAFCGCSDLVSLAIPASVSSIDDTFWGCSSLTGFSVASDNPSYKAVEGVLFNKAGTEIHCFPNGQSRTTYTIPDGVGSIREAAFANCSRLQSLIIPQSVASIGAYAFYGCTGLTSLILSADLARIGDSAFYDCNHLSALVIPDGVLSIGGSAFGKCTGLSILEIPASVSTIGPIAFYDCTGLATIDVAIANTAYKSIEGILYDKAGTTLICCPSGNVISDFTVPDTVVAIEGWAFNRCAALTTIVVNSATPPRAGTAVFSFCDKLDAIRVPASHVATYKTATGWSDYSNLIEAIL